MNNVTKFRKPLIVQEKNFLFNPKGIPEELKKVNQWVVWSLVKINESDDKSKKLPIYIDSRDNEAYLSSWKDQNRLISFEEAMSLYNSSDKIHALGFVFTENDPFVFIDMDNMDDTDEEDPRYNFIPNDSFMEYSQSGKGLHIVIKSGKSFTGINQSADLGLELYSEGRFVALTGWIKTQEPKPVRTKNKLLHQILDYIEIHKDSQELETISEQDLSLEHYIKPTYVPCGQRDNEVLRFAGHLSLKNMPIEEAKKEMSLFVSTILEQPEGDEFLLSDAVEKLERAYGNAEEFKQRKNKGFIDRYVFIDTDDKYYDLETHHAISKGALNSTYAHSHTGRKGELPKMSNLIDSHPKKQIAQGYTWLPIPHGEKGTDLINHKRARYVNTWSGFAVDPIEGDISQWLKVLDHILPDPKEQEIYIKRLAFDIQHPDKKCNWHTLFVGKKGVGKDLVTTPMSRIFGEYFGSVNNKQIGSDYDDAFVNKKFLSYNEVKGLKGDTLEKIKQRTTSEAGLHQLMNVKSKGQVLMPNLWSFHFNTNHYDAISFTPDERRFFCFECTIPMSDEFGGPFTRDEIAEMAEQIKYCADFPSAFMDYMLNIDLSDFDPGVMPYHTKTFYKMVEAAKSDVQMDLDEYLEKIPDAFIDPQRLLEWLRTETGFHNISKRRVINELYQRDWVNLNQYTKIRICKKVNGKIEYKPRSYMVKKDNTELFDKKGSELFDMIDDLEKEWDAREFN